MGRIKDFLIPHVGNDYRPHFFHERSVEVVLVVIIFLSFIYPLQQFVMTRTDLLAAIYPKALITLANEDRIQNNLSNLTVNPVLAEAARLKAEDMVKNGYFAHNSPTGVTPWYWISKAGYQYLYAGENLAVDFAESDTVNAAWMNSSTHRANILNPNYTEIGIATARGIYQGRETTFVVQMFGRPNTLTQTRMSNPKVKAGFVERTALLAATNPSKVITYAYSAIGIFIAVALGLLILVEVKRQHTRSIVFGALLLIITLSFILIFGIGAGSNITIAAS